jgi:Icc protein
MPWIAQLTDSHLDGGDADARFERVVAWLEQVSPPVDVIVLTGDLVETSAVADVPVAYAALAGRLAAIAPLIAIPGNCDDPAALAAAFPVPDIGVPALGANAVLVVADAVAVIGLDSSIRGEIIGRLSPETMAWLESALAALPADMPVILAMHHPPLELGHTLVDGYRLQDAEALEDLVAEESRILGILVGHTHGATATSFAGKPLIVGPGIHSAMTLEHEPPQTPPSLMDFATQPGVALHWIDGGRMTTHFRNIAG